MDFFDLFGRNGAPPKNLACAPVDAERGESFVFPIKFRQENTSTPNDGRRQSRPDGSLPEDILVWAKVNGRFAFAESRGIRSSKLGPPHFAALLRPNSDARQNDGCQKSDQRNSFHVALPVCAKQSSDRSKARLRPSTKPS
jgi:hypothetical protein